MSVMALEKERADQSAKALISQVLGDYGLGGLVSWAWERYLNVGNADQVMVELRDRPEYQARFPYMKALGQAGRAISEAQAISYERSVAQLMQAYGIPKEMYDQPDDFSRLLTNNVDLPELESRIKLNQAAARSRPEVINAFRQMYGADGDAMATAYWLDPDRAQPVLEQRLMSAQARGAAVGTGFGDINQAQAERLAASGVNEEQARQGFNSLAGLGDLRKNLVGEDDNFNNDDLIAAAFESNSAVQRRLDARRRARMATFGGGGTFTSSTGGFGGIGAAR